MGVVSSTVLLPCPSRASGVVVLGRFETGYVTDAEHKGRAFNVELAAQSIHDKTIGPLATFSFNDAVGERTASFGYARAVVLRDGMISEGVGGGACQVASTLHAAALLSGLDIVARAPHSRPSAYIRMGLDATVVLSASTAVDLRLKNPYPHPVTVHAFAKKGTLLVEIRGGEGAVRPTITLTSEILERLPFGRTIERDHHVPDETVRRKAYGIPGYRVKRTRIIERADETTQRDVRVDLYPPIQSILTVSPSFNEARLRPTDGDEESDVGPLPPPPPFSVDRSVMRPAAIQLRPSTIVTLMNDV